MDTVGNALMIKAGDQIVLKAGRRQHHHDEGRHHMIKGQTLLISCSGTVAAKAGGAMTSEGGE